MKRRKGGAVTFLVGVAACIMIFLVILQWLGTIDEQNSLVGFDFHIRFF